MTGCPGAPRTGWVGQRCAGRSLEGGRALGGGTAERLGGGGDRSRSQIAGSGGRASLRPAATGRVADGGGPMKTNEGPGSIYLLWISNRL